MRRRAFIALLGGVAEVLAAVLAANGAAAGERMRRVGVLMGMAQGDAGSARRVAALYAGSANWDGPKVAICGSIIAGKRALTTRGAPPPRNSPSCGPM